MKKLKWSHVLASVILISAFLGSGAWALEPSGLPDLPREVQGLASSSAARWRIEQVDSGGVGNHSSLAFDSSDRPHISYYDFTNDDLKYAHKDETGWHIVTVDSAGFVGAFTSLALDANDRPHISYCSCTTHTCSTCDDLKYAWHDGTTWHSEPVDSGGDVGGYTSLVVDSAGRHISYYDFTKGDLKYAHKPWLGTWTSTPVDGAMADVGFYTSLALDAGQRFISYLDNTGKQLKYAHYDGSWHVQSLDAATDTGWYTSLDLCRTPSAVAPRITYYSNGELRYAHKWLHAGWTFATLDSDPPGPTSLALDPLCRVHVSYFELTNGDLRYTYQDVSGWHTETVDDDGDVSPYWSSLALDSQGWPCISYYDDTDYGDSQFGLSYACKMRAVYLPIVLRSVP